MDEHAGAYQFFRWCLGLAFVLVVLAFFLNWRGW